MKSAPSEDEATKEANARANRVANAAASQAAQKNAATLTTDTSAVYGRLPSLFTVATK